MGEKRYRKEFAALAEALARSGVSETEIARLLEIPPATLARWRAVHPEMKQALSTPSAADRAEAALLKRALGFRQEEASSEELIDKKSGELLEVLKRRVITKEIPPDVRALLFWLKNRCPARWNERAGAEDEYHYEEDPDEADL